MLSINVNMSYIMEIDLGQKIPQECADAGLGGGEGEQDKLVIVLPTRPSHSAQL